MAGTRSAPVRYSKGGVRADTRKLDQAQKATDARFDALSDEFDDLFGSTRGSVLVRGQNGWIVRTPTTSGHVLKFDGTDTNFAAQILPKREVLWDRTAGTNIGNMTSDGGIAAAFDGNKDQTNSASAQGSSSLGSSFVGKAFGSAKIISRIVAYAPNNQFFNNNQGVVAIEIWAKNGAPSSSTDGTLISAPMPMTAPGHSDVRMTWSTDFTNAYTHAWARVNNRTAGAQYMTELEIYTLEDATS